VGRRTWCGPSCRSNKVVSRERGVRAGIETDGGGDRELAGTGDLGALTRPGGGMVKGRRKGGGVWQEGGEKWRRWLRRRLAYRYGEIGDVPSRTFGPPAGERSTGGGVGNCEGGEAW